MDIYRKEALQHLESPEQLDTMMQVTEPRQWVALTGLCLFLVVFLIWGTVSRVPVLVTGQGILRSEGGIKAVYAPAPGKLTKLDLRTGQQVKEGDVVGQIVPLDGTKAVDIVCPGSGEVSEVLADLWSPVEYSTPLFRIGSESGALKLVMFLTPEEGATIHSGMAVQVYPTVSGQSDYGHMLGTVQQVARYPSSTEGMMHVLGNADLVQQLSRDAVPLAVLVDLQSDAQGYLWSGPTSVNRPKIHGGLLCSGKIAVQERTPMSLILGSH